METQIINLLLAAGIERNQAIILTRQIVAILKTWVFVALSDFVNGSEI